MVNIADRYDKIESLIRESGLMVRFPEQPNKAKRLATLHHIIIEGTEEEFSDLYDTVEGEICRVKLDETQPSENHYVLNESDKEIEYIASILPERVERLWSI